MSLRRWLTGVVLAGGVALAVHHTRGANDATSSSSDVPQAAVPVKRAITSGITRGGQPPAKSDTLLRSYPDDPDTVNPLTANDNISEEFQRLVYEQLAERKYSNPDEWEPALAESWEFDPKTLEYTIHLRKGVKWHPITLPSGKKLPATEFTARDVKFTFDCILNKNVEAASLRSYYEDPSPKQESEKYKIQVSLVRGDKYTVKVKWTKPYFMADDFTLGAMIIPRHIFSVNEKGDPVSFDFSSKEFADGFNNHWANRAMCGTGPMIFREWVKDQRVVLERNPDYWGEPYSFDRVVYRHIKNPNTAVQQLLQNELDWSVIPEKDLYIQSLTHPNVVAKKVMLDKLKYPQYRYLGYNIKRGFFKDTKVRWAIGHAIPLDEIITNIYHGLAVRLTGPFLPDSQSNDKSLPLIDFDLDKARALLDEAGWKMAEGDSVRSQMINGKKVDAKFDLMIYSDSPSYASISTIIKENCRKIGVDVGISSTNWALMLQKLRKKDFDACILGWQMTWKDDPYQIWHGSQANLPESSNAGGYRNPEVDKLIEQLRVTMNPEKQIEIYHKIHRLIYDDQPYTFLFMDLETYGYDARIENVKPYPIRPCIDTREWFAKTPRRLGQ